ncbi:hypothetical protein BD410DRAFT_846518 [Rickenella mellea]|uniref:Uncharacterized protein n=1 Tax=Rickenella mellea TaxID=50990 RepID=A0A4Y7PFU9_9AGAM|nr:hypothetical protein BD410DRAFT_846518 [Rickenella mellea]
MRRTEENENTFFFEHLPDFVKLQQLTVHKQREMGVFWQTIKSLWSEKFKESLPTDEAKKEKTLAKLETRVKRIKNWYNNRTRKTDNSGSNLKASKPAAKGSKYVFKAKQKLQPYQAYQKLFQDELKGKVDAEYKIYSDTCLANGEENKGRLFICNKVAKAELASASQDVIARVEAFRNESKEEDVPEYLAAARDDLSEDDFDRYMDNHHGLTRFVHTSLDKISSQIGGVAIILIGAPEPQNDGNVVTWM